ncbi:MAG TPA: glycosyltransferase [Woeseiaceae bacterium]
MTLTVLNVAYPLAPVGPDAAGGAEQVLARIDAALTANGDRSVVIACEGSRVTGTLLPTPVPASPLDEIARAMAQARHRVAVQDAVLCYRPDVVHLHGFDFSAYLPPPGGPALVTLHLPPAWYPATALRPKRPDTWLHCVSAAERRACPADAPLLDDIANGVETEAFAARHSKRPYVLCLGRICPEKGVHLALDAATEARLACLVAGALYAYPAHEEYFRTAVLPRLRDRHRWLGPVGFARKRRLLSAARALLVPSLAPETSSLVAMEALACGTPVIAYAAGALPDIVDHGRTGFLVGDVAGMAAAIAAAGTLDTAACRRAAGERFRVEHMTARYLETYRRLAQGEARMEAHSHAA